MDDNKLPAELAQVEWIGDSLKAVQSFPQAVRFDFGGEIWKLQLGERPTNYRPMPSIGSGVFELRQRDQAGWYRIIYLSKVDDVIYMLHAFKKQTAKTSRRDVNIAETRLKAARRLIQDKRKDA